MTLRSTAEALLCILALAGCSSAPVAPADWDLHEVHADAGVDDAARPDGDKQARHTMPQDAGEAATQDGG